MHPKPSPGAKPEAALPMPPEALLRIDDVLKLFPSSRTTVYELVSQQVFPAPHRLGRATFWRYGEVMDFLRRDPAELNEKICAARAKAKAARCC